MSDRKIFDRLGSKMKILNFGSLNIDYVYDVEHFVKKGETISSKGLNVFPGGKGLNQSIAIKRAGIDVYHAGVVGEDGTFLISTLENAGVNTEYIFVSNKARTGNAIIQRDATGDNSIILYPGANRRIEIEYIDKVLSNFGEGDYLVLQNEISNLDYIIKRASLMGMKIVLNPSPMDELVLSLDLSLIDYFILNEYEASVLLKEEYVGRECVSKLKERFKKASILLTLGSRGAIFMKDTLIYEVSGVKVKAVDTTAAGDTFTGYFVAGLIKELDVEANLSLANKAAAIAVTRNGAATSIPKIEEVISH